MPSADDHAAGDSARATAPPTANVEDAEPTAKALARERTLPMGASSVASRESMCCVSPGSTTTLEKDALRYPFALAETV